MKYAVRYLKNTFYPLDVADDFQLSDGQMVIVRTEKGEEALKVFVVNSKNFGKNQNKSLRLCLY